MKNETFKEDYIEEITEEEEKERRKRFIVLIIIFLFLLLIVFSTLFARSTLRRYYIFGPRQNLEVDVKAEGSDECIINCHKGIYYVNISTTSSYPPLYNLTYKNGNIPFFNIISILPTGVLDLTLVFNPINVRGFVNGRNVCIRNCDVDGDNKPDINVDFNGDGIIDLNFDSDYDGLCDYNCDVLGLSTPNYRVDVDGDKKPDVNIGVEGGTVPLYNISLKPNYTVPYFNIINKPYDEIDFNNETVFNPVTTPVNGSTLGLTNVDVDGDGWPEVNIVLDPNKNIGDNKVDYLNKDVDGDGVADLNIDLDGDGKADINIDIDFDNVCEINCDTDSDGIVDTHLSESVDLKDYGIYVIEFADADGNSEFTIVPGWTGSKAFTVRNTSDETLAYKIDFTSVVNTITEENNLYYGLIKDGETMVDITTARAPYADGNLVNNVTILPGETHTYVITFEFRDTGVNQDVDKNKEFYTKLQIKNI